jgi:tetratricopeptide (TPR) repeat protein
MSASPPAPNDFLARFQRKITRNAAAWQAFLAEHGDDPAVLDRELANLTKAAQQALLEPQAWDEGLALLGQTWPHVELRGQWQAWQALLAQGLEVSRQAGRAGIEALLLDQLGEVARLLGDNRGAQEHFQAALALYRDLADSAGAGRALSHLSQAQLALNHWNAAVQSCQQAVALLTGLDQPNEMAIAHNNWGIICAEQGQFEDALAHFEQAEASFRTAGNLRGQAKLILNRGDFYRRRQQWDVAESFFRQALALHEELGDRHGIAMLQMNLSILLYQRGEPAAALALSIEAETTLRRLHNRPILARVCNNHGMFLSALGRPAEAQEAFEEAARLHLENGDRLYAADSLNNCANALLDEGRLHEARGYLARARAWLELLPSLPDWMLEDCERLAARLELPAGAQSVT